MGSQLELSIDSVRGNGVYRWSQHNNQKSTLLGLQVAESNGYNLTLTESSIGPSMGLFVVQLDSVEGTVRGIWKPLNNPELSEARVELKRKTQR